MTKQIGVLQVTTPYATHPRILAVLPVTTGTSATQVSTFNTCSKGTSAIWVCIPLNTSNIEYRREIGYAIGVAVCAFDILVDVTMCAFDIVVVLTICAFDIGVDFTAHFDIEAYAIYLLPASLTFYL